jgi:sterol desaturase/sphingolipid hydroxylase (fatty acid hydroxylase superfamily)
MLHLPCSIYISVSHETQQAFQEWALHKYATHEMAGFAKDKHTEHHDLPYYHICIDDWQAAVPGGGTASALVAIAITAAGVPQALCFTVIFYYFAMGFIYEFVHFISHTRVPCTGWLGTIKQHHMKHHLVDQSCAFAFTAPIIDTLMGRDKRDSRSCTQFIRHCSSIVLHTCTKQLLYIMQR